MTFGEAISSVFSKYAKFSGRARRSEYWYFVLFNVLVSVGLSLIGLINEKLNILSSIYSLAVFLPSMAVVVRRLHDIGKSGWYYLFPLIPIVLMIICSLFLVIVFGVSYSRSYYGSYSGSYSSSPTVLSVILILVLILAIIATIVISIIFLVWMCRDSQPGTNKWGPNPKENPDDSLEDFEPRAYQDYEQHN